MAGRANALRRPSTRRRARARRRPARAPATATRPGRVRSDARAPRPARARRAAARAPARTLRAGRGGSPAVGTRDGRWPTRAAAGGSCGRPPGGATRSRSALDPPRALLEREAAAAECRVQQRAHGVEAFDRVGDLVELPEREPAQRLGIRLAREQLADL